MASKTEAIRDRATALNAPNRELFPELALLTDSEVREFLDKMNRAGKLTIPDSGWSMCKLIDDDTLGVLVDAYFVARYEHYYRETQGC